MKTPKAKDAYPAEYETFEDMPDGVPLFIGTGKARRFHSARGILAPHSQGAQRPHPCQDRREFLPAPRDGHQQGARLNADWSPGFLRAPFSDHSVFLVRFRLRWRQGTGACEDFRGKKSEIAGMKRGPVLSPIASHSTTSAI